MKRIGAGIIGGGFIGKIHAEALRRLGNVDLKAIASRNDEIALKRGEELSIEKCYGRYSDLIKDDDVEIVHICTTNDLHFAIAKECIEAGKHIVCEKPLAMTSKESAELVRLAEKKGVVNCLCHNMRYYPLVKQAREMVRKGDLGDIRLIHGHYLQDWLFLDTDYNWRVSSEQGGASRTIADIGTHWLDMVQHVTGQKVVSVYADLTTFIPVRKKPLKEVDTYSSQELKPEDYEKVPVNTEDHGTVMLKFSGGAKGVLIACQVAAGRKNFIHFEINGSKRSVEWGGEHPNHMWIGERGRVNGEFIKNPTLMEPDAAKYAGAPCGLGEGYLDTFKSILSDLYGWILSGKEMDMKEAKFPTFLTGHEELVIVDAVLESSKKGKWVDTGLQ